MTGSLARSADVGTPSVAAAEAGRPGQADPPPELLRHVVATTGLPPAIAARVISDVTGYFAETAGQFVRRRHAELRRQHKNNDEIWGLIARELAARPVAPPPASARQLRRMVYG